MEDDFYCTLTSGGGEGSNRRAAKPGEHRRIMKKSWTEAEVEEVERRYRDGETDEEIALALGRSEGSVSNLRQARHIHRPVRSLRRPPPWSTKDLATAARMYDAGYTRHAIALAVGRTPIAIKRAASTFGWTRSEVSSVGPHEFDTPNERWRAIPGSRYAASDKGRIMSLVPGNVGLILSPWTDAEGYKHVTLFVAGRNTRFAVHGLVLTAFVNPRPAGLQGAHNNGNPSDNRLENLRWATPTENYADRIAHGNARRAEGAGRWLVVDR